MKALVWFAAVALAGLPGAPARGDEKTDYAKLIVGKWEVSKADEGTVPVGAAIEFTKDGKVKATAKKDDVEMSFEGTYKVEKDTLTLTMNVGGQEKTTELTITKASDKELSVKDKDGKTVEFKKK